MELVETVGTTMRSDNAQQGINGTRLARSRCRFCQTPLKDTFFDLGISPCCESLITEEQFNMMEPLYPLHVFSVASASWCSFWNT